MQLTHPNKNSPQYAYSERDIAWLEKQGWVRVGPPKVEQAKAVLLRRKASPGDKRKVSPGDVGFRPE